MNKAQIRLVAGDDKREFGETREVAFLYRTDLWGAAVRAYRKATGRCSQGLPQGHGAPRHARTPLQQGRRRSLHSTVRARLRARGYAAMAPVHRTPDRRLTHPRGSSEPLPAAKGMTRRQNEVGGGRYGRSVVNPCGNVVAAGTHIPRNQSGEKFTGSHEECIEHATITAELALCNHIEAASGGRLVTWGVASPIVHFDDQATGGRFSARTIPEADAIIAALDDLGEYQLEPITDAMRDRMAARA